MESRAGRGRDLIGPWGDGVLRVCLQLSGLYLEKRALKLLMLSSLWCQY